MFRVLAVVKLDFSVRHLMYDTVVHINLTRLVRICASNTRQLPTQLYIAYVYTGATLLLFVQHLYYSSFKLIQLDIAELEDQLLHTAMEVTHLQYK
jgi:hypothetical protein